MRVKLVDLSADGLVLFLQGLEQRTTLVVAKNSQTQTSFAREFPHMRVVSRAGAFDLQAPPLPGGVRTAVVEGAGELPAFLREQASLEICVRDFRSGSLVRAFRARARGDTVRCFQGQDAHEMLRSSGSEIVRKFPTLRQFFELEGRGYAVQWNGNFFALNFCCFDPWPLLETRLGSETASEICLVNFGTSEAVPASLHACSRVCVTRSPEIRVVGDNFPGNFPDPSHPVLVIGRTRSYGTIPEIPRGKFSVFFARPEIQPPSAFESLSASASTTQGGELDLLFAQWRHGNFNGEFPSFTRRFQLLCLATQAAETWYFCSATRKFLDLIPGNISDRPRPLAVPRRPDPVPLADGEKSNPFFQLDRNFRSTLKQTTLTTWMSTTRAVDRSDQVVECDESEISDPSSCDTILESPDLRHVARPLKQPRLG